MHPFSVAEILHAKPPGDNVIRAPEALADREFDALWEHGGFPEPFVKRDPRFTRRWQQLRKEQLLRQDVRDLTRIQEISQLEILADVLAVRSGTQIVYGNLAQDVGVSIDTVRRWIEALAGLHYGFLVRPWFRNVSRALRKEPKWYLRDWSVVTDAGARSETFVACHLLKAVDGWTDLGLGNFELRYVRDKEKHEVDFVVIRDKRPWFIVEVKASDTSLSPALAYFQKALAAPHAFQAVLTLPHVRADCFERRDPTVVPARTLLAQLL
jgi:predicted AAA+ superfamily ATPase